MDKLASPTLKRRFFLLANRLGYDPEMIKERAKKKYGLISFANIQTEELQPLVDALQERVETTMIRCPHCRGTGYVKKETLENE